MKHELKVLAFWSINDELNVERLCRQLDGLKADGYQGAIWHMRYYPFKKHYLSQDYMDTVSKVILYAKSIDMEFWLYDENGWPSGHASGKVRKAYRNCRCEWLEPRKNGRVVKKFKKRVNILDRHAMDIFQEITYEGYRQKLDPEAWEYVMGFFSDEVGFLEGHGILKKTGAIPWCPEINERYGKQYGENPEKDFPKLFNDMEGAEEFRMRYWRILTDVLADNFYKRLSDWCAKYGKKYTAHLKAEENLYFQMPFSGSAFQNLKQISVPAVDALERYKSSNYFPRIASSLAKQYSTGEALTEAIGGSGFGLSPTDFYNYLDWLAECGHRTFVMHICQYCYKGNAIRDWPPAIPFSQTWQDAMPGIIKALKDKYNDKDLHNDTLVIVPGAQVMRKFIPIDHLGHNGHNGIGIKDDPAGIISKKFTADIEKFYGYKADFDVTEEFIIDEEAIIKDGKVTIGNETYSEIYYSDDCYFGNSEKAEELKKIAKSLDTYFQENADVSPVNHIVEGLGLEDKTREKQQLAERYAGWLGDETPRYDFKVTDFGENVIQPEIIKGICGCKAIVPLKDGKDIGELEFLFTDPIKSLRINGKSYKLEGEFDRYTLKLNAADLGDVIKIKYKEKKRKWYHKKPQKPFLFINGNFLVKTVCDYEPLDYHQTMTDGAFYLQPAEKGMSSEDLIAAGFPFMHNFVKVEAEIEFGGKLELHNLFADATKVFIDGKDYGYVLDTPATVECPDVAYGKHKVELVMYPSSYNKFGPHHHYEGDRHICPPTPFVTEKHSGFADWPDAPEIVLDAKWRFVKFGI